MTGSSFSTGAAFVQMIAALALVLGIIFILSWFARRRFAAMGARSSAIRIVETRQMGPRSALLLVEVGGEYLLLASGPEGITLLKQVDVIEDIEIIGDANPVPVQFQQKLEQMLATLKPTTLAALQQRKERQ